MALYYTVNTYDLTSRAQVDELLRQHSTLLLVPNDWQDPNDLYRVRRMLGEDDYFYRCEFREYDSGYFLSFKSDNDPESKLPFFGDYSGKITETHILNNLVKITEYDSVAKMASFAHNSSDAISWKDLKGKLPSTIEILHLGANGLTGENDTIDDVVKVISELPCLRLIEYCAHYSQFTKGNFENAFANLGRDLRTLTCLALC